MAGPHEQPSPSEHPGDAAESAGIVDQQAAALEAIEDDEADDQRDPRDGEAR